MDIVKLPRETNPESATSLPGRFRGDSTEYNLFLAGRELGRQVLAVDDPGVVEERLGILAGIVRRGPQPGRETRTATRSDVRRVESWRSAGYNDRS